MISSLSRTSGVLDCTNSRDISYEHGSVPKPGDNAVSSGSINQARSARPDCRGDYSYYEAFLSTDSASGSSENNVPCNSGGTTCHSFQSEDRGAYCFGEQANDKPRAMPPYNVAVRFTSRSNGIPLPTIIEKGSNSTLQSHASQFSVTCRYPLTPTSNGRSPASVPQAHRACRSLDETTLHRIQEHANHEQESTTERIDDHASPGSGPAISCPTCNSPVPIKASSHQHQPSEPSQLVGVDNESEGKGLKGLLRDVIQHVRGASRRSETQSSCPPPPSADNRSEEERSTTEMSSHAGNSGDESDSFQADKPASCHSPIAECPQLPLNEANEAFEDWAEDCERSLIDPETSARDVSQIRHILPSEDDASEEVTLLPEQLSPPSRTAVPVRDEKTSSNGFAAPDDGQVVSSPGLPLHRSREDHSRYTLDGIPIFSNAPSLHEFDRAREVSFCGTASTSYSGTVLGIDLDLRQEFHTARAPCRTPTPVWFSTPTPELLQHNTETTPPTAQQAPPRSVTSSALPALLPLAAASGIVQSNTAMGVMSFYSPSGTLIQAHQSSRTSSTGQAAQSLSAESEPPARPAAVPLTTPPQSSIPLPRHLMQKQKSGHHHTRSLIVPQPGIASGVKGCDGVVRKNSFTPRSGIRRPSTLKQHKSNQSASTSSSQSSLSFRSRFSAVASCAPLQRIQNGKISKRDSGRRPLPRSGGGGGTGASAPGMGSMGISPFAGRTFRVCFCQPMDAAAASSAGERHAGAGGGMDDAAPSGTDDGANVPARIVGASGLPRGVGRVAVGAGGA